MPRDSLMRRHLHQLLQLSACLYLEPVVLPRVRMDGGAEEVSLVLLASDGGPVPVMAAFRQATARAARSR